MSVISLLIVASFSCGDDERGQIIVSPGRLDFGASVLMRELVISSSNEDSLFWSISGRHSWISFSEKKGLATKIPRQISVFIDRNKIAPGSYESVLQITYKGGYVSVPVSLLAANRVPEVAIKLPRNNTEYSVENLITFIGVGSDSEDGTLDSRKFIWRSDKDGDLGNGNNLMRSLSEGQHKITLIVEDINGATETASIALNVIDESNGSRVINSQASVLTVPRNTTESDFIEGGAQQASSKTLTLNISAEDETGVVAYFVNDSDVKGKKYSLEEMKKNWSWRVINSTIKYKAVVTHLVEQEYPAGTKLYVNVWFRNAEGIISQKIQDSIVLNSRMIGQIEDVIEQGENDPLSRQELTSAIIPVDIRMSSPRQAGGASSQSVSASPLESAIGTGSFSLAGKGNNEAGENTDDTNADVIYFMDFERGYDGWWVDNGLWEIGTPSGNEPSVCYMGASCAATVLSGNYSDYIASRLVSPTIVLPEADGGQRIELKFFHWYNLHTDDLAKFQISIRGSSDNWSDWSTLLVQSGTTSIWKPTTVDVTKYAGKTLRVGFYLHQSSNKAGVKDGWYIDNFSISELK